MPNDDLISRKALYAAWDKIDEMEFNDQNLRIDEMIRLTQAAPAVDAEPVRHGKWIETYAYGAWHYDCPFCDDGYATKEREKKPVNYCPNCGAKMDEKEG